MLSLLRVRASLIRTALIAALAFTLGSTSAVFGLVVDGVVEACYNNATGVLRLATATRPCMTAVSYGLLRETPISWNQDSSAEAAARQAADAALQGNIDAEAAARAAADTTLQNNIAAEAASRQAADAALQGNIDAEAAARAAADTTLQSNVATEAAARTAADAALQGNIDAEAAARAAADTALQNNIAAEAATRQAADAALQNNVDAEAAGRAAADTTLQGNITVGDTATLTAAKAYTDSKLTNPSFTSPNGLFSLTITNSGIVLSGPNGTVTVASTGIQIQGAIVTLNGSCGGVANMGDPVLPGSFFAPGAPGPITGTGTIGQGSTTVFVC